MPAIIPVIAAVAATAGAGFAVAGAVAGTVAVATAGFAVVGALGATMSAVGTITKNKTLSMVGMGLGVVGGIGSLATAAGVFGSEAGSIFTAANQGGMAITDQAAASAATAAGVAPGTPLGVPDPNLPTPPVPPPGGEMGATWAGPDVSEAAATAGANPFQENASLKDVTTASVESDQQGVAKLETQNPGDLSKDPLGRPIPEPPPAPPSGVDADGISTAPGGTTRGWQTPGKWETSGPGTANVSENLFTKIGDKFTDISDWAESHKVLSGAMLQGTKALFGAMTPGGLTEAQTNAYNAQAAANNAAAKMRDQQTANIAAPKPQSYFPVTGNVAPQGIINRAPTQMVTGTPA